MERIGVGVCHAVLPHLFSLVKLECCAASWEDKGDSLEAECPHAIYRAAKPCNALVDVLDAHAQKPDDTLLPFDEWAQKVEAVIAECEARNHQRSEEA